MAFGYAGAAAGAAKSLEDIVAQRMLEQKLAAEIANRQELTRLEGERVNESKRSSLADEGQRQQQIDLTDRARRDRNNTQGLELMDRDKNRMDEDAIVGSLPPELQQIAKLRRVGVSGISPQDLQTPEQRAAAQAEADKHTLKMDEEKAKITAKYRPPPAPGLDQAGLAFVNRWAEQTGTLPPMGMAGGARIQAINSIGANSPNLNVGETQAEFSSGKQSLASMTKMYDAVSAYEQTANKNLDVMLKAAQPIIDTGSPWLNRPLREWDERALGSTELAAFNAARTVVIPEFARIISNPNLTGVLTNEQRAEVDKIMRGDSTLPQMIAVSKVLQSDAKNRVSSLQQQMGTRKDALPGGAPPQSTPTPAAAPPPPAGKRMRFDKTGKPIP